MSDHCSRLVRKCDDDDGPPVKRQKLENVEVAKSDTKIHQLNNDCLELVFGHLKFKDLFCLAMASDQLDSAAAMVFRRKYGKNEIKFTGDGITHLIEDEYLGFSVKQASTYKSFLHKFGAQLSKLNIEVQSTMYTAVEPILRNDCLVSLVELSLGDCRYESSKLSVFGSIEQPFQNVEKLSLNRCHLNENASKLNKWFPALSSLSLYDNSYSDPNTIIAEYPKIVLFSAGSWRGPADLTEAQILAILRLNPTIQCLDIGLAADGNELDFYRQVNDILPQLERLQMCWEAKSFANGNEVITFKAVKNLTLNFTFNAFTGARVLPFAFDQLMEMELINMPIVNNTWLEFIGYNKKLTKLMVLPFNEDGLFMDRPNNQDLLRIAKELPNLITLAIDVTRITTDCIVQFMQMCQSLTTLQLYWNDLNSFNHNVWVDGTFFEQIDGEWNIPKRIISPITLKRKGI
ncbi:uncharacterized protein LOC116347985 [Contarinia nasturtii]|uniref:uncharacterized protein LOC116347985 n=1 Tax=Contarinia nasturtii TaxID=265458 RepID=UPI0012D380BD|nr:uncharacterized protein LOC116347985 [Contarinia nasturtii]XP_031634683.1 uncharacterized protein LOC116347985 [Contarinia nasturtii]